MLDGARSGASRHHTDAVGASRDARDRRESTSRRRRRRRAAATVVPAQVNAKRCLGNAWVARSDIPRAIRRYGAAIEIGDSDYDITDEDEKRRLREAVAACKLNRAMCHLKLKHYADCEKDCSDVLDIDPSSVKALFRQGKCYLALDKWDAAKESFRKVLELDDGNMEARRGLQSVRVSVCVKINQRARLRGQRRMTPEI